MVSKEYITATARASRNLATVLVIESLVAATTLGSFTYKEIEKNPNITSGVVYIICTGLALYAFRRAREANNLARRIESDITERIN